jgi:hypothetical protein
LLEQKLEFLLRLRVASEQYLTPISSRDANIDHLHGGKFLKRIARGESGREGFELPTERYV